MNVSKYSGFKKFVSNLFSLSRIVMHIGFIPFVLYMGFSKGADEGMPPISLMSLFFS